VDQKCRGGEKNLVVRKRGGGPLNTCRLSTKKEGTMQENSDCRGSNRVNTDVSYQYQSPKEKDNSRDEVIKNENFYAKTDYSKEID